MQRQIMVIHTPFRHLEMIESDGTQRQIMVILHLCHPEAASPMTCGRTIWSCTFFHLLSSRGGGPDDMRWNLMVPHFFHLLSSRDGGSDDMRGNLMVPHLFFTIQRQSSPIERGDKLWSSAQLFVNQRQASPLTRRDKLWSFCTFVIQRRRAR